MKEDAASPLAVIATFVLVAVGLTTLLFFLFVDTTNELLELQETNDRFVVTSTEGNLEWGDLRVQLVDRAGADRTDFLTIPDGAVEEGDAIEFASMPPGGEYLLLVTLDGQELVRLRVVV